MTRRALVLTLFAVCCRAADPAGEVIDLFTDVAGSLSAGNVSRFLGAFDPAMPGYARLRDNVTALAAQGEVQSFIDPITNEGDDTRRAVEWKWTLRIRRGQDRLREVQPRFAGQVVEVVGRVGQAGSTGHTAQRSP